MNDTYECEACGLSFATLSSMVDHTNMDIHRSNFVMAFGFSDDACYTEFSREQLLAYKKYIEERHQQYRGHYIGVIRLLETAA